MIEGNNFRARNDGPYLCRTVPFGVLSQAYRLDGPSWIERTGYERYCWISETKGTLMLRISPNGKIFLGEGHLGLDCVTHF